MLTLDSFDSIGKETPSVLEIHIAVASELMNIKEVLLRLTCLH